MEKQINWDPLLKNSEAHAARYRSADPYPHIVIDDFLDPTIYQTALAEYPGPETIGEWRRAEAYDKSGHVAQVLKLGLNDERLMGPVLRNLVYTMNSGHFLRYLEKLTGIANLLPDPHLVGGGLHQYLPGAVLAVHADFSKLRGSNLDRRLNLLLYLNREWDAAWGGELELWDREMQACRQRVQPIGNRCVIFSTTGTSYHGVPEPLACPAGVTRRSLALYYYSNGRPENEAEPTHATLWQARPGK